MKCSCGHGEGANHPLGQGNCCRMIAVGSLIPKNFRMEVWSHYAGTESEETFLTEVCDVGGTTITVFTLREQRMYHFHEDCQLWSLPKSMDSVNSIGDDW